MFSNSAILLNSSKHSSHFFFLMSGFGSNYIPVGLCFGSWQLGAVIHQISLSVCPCILMPSSLWVRFPEVELLDKGCTYFKFSMDCFASGTYCFFFGYAGV
jgi:hypothetical protein